MKKKKKEDEKIHNEPPFSTADMLADMEIRTLGDAKNFMVGVNNLASEISMGRVHTQAGPLTSLHTLGSPHGATAITTGPIYPFDSTTQLSVAGADSFEAMTNSRLVIGAADVDIGKLNHGITSVLAYGQSVNDSAILFRPDNRTNMVLNDASPFATYDPYAGTYRAPVTTGLAQPLSLSLSQEITSPYIFSPKDIGINPAEEIPEMKAELRLAKKNAQETVARLEKIEAEGKEKDKEIENLRGTIEELRVEVKVIRDAKFIRPMQENVNVGPLSCKDGHIYYGKNYINFLPQERDLCQLLLQASKDNDSFVSSDTIEEIVGRKNGMTHKNMLKIVSKVRRRLREVSNSKIRIDPRNSDGFILVLKDIR